MLLYYVANEVYFKGQFAFSRNGGRDKLKTLNRIRDLEICVSYDLLRHYLIIPIPQNSNFSIH